MYVHLHNYTGNYFETLLYTRSLGIMIISKNIQLQWLWECMNKNVVTLTVIVAIYRCVGAVTCTHVVRHHIIVLDACVDLCIVDRSLNVCKGVNIILIHIFFHNLKQLSNLWYMPYVHLAKGTIVHTIIHGRKKLISSSLISILIIYEAIHSYSTL